MKIFFLFAIKIYQKTISPDHGFIFSGGAMRCRFYPSCSQYTYEAVEKYGAAKGMIKGLVRVFRCGPFSGGGADLLK